MESRVQLKYLSTNLFRTRMRVTMRKNTVTDPITDQEIAFAQLVLSGTTLYSSDGSGTFLDFCVVLTNPVADENYPVHPPGL